MKRDLILFAAYHRPYPIPPVDFIYPVQAGKALSKLKLDLPGDDTGDQISERNEFYSELTILYWLWKNFDRTQMKYWGIVHYRRYFCLDNTIGRLSNKKIYSYHESGDDIPKVINEEFYKTVVKDLQENDLILPKQMHVYKKKGVTKSITEHYLEGDPASDRGKIP
jgi:hypothetical protein